MLLPCFLALRFTPIKFAMKIVRRDPSKEFIKREFLRHRGNFHPKAVIFNFQLNINTTLDSQFIDQSLGEPNRKGITPL